MNSVFSIVLCISLFYYTIEIINSVYFCANVICIVDDGFIYNPINFPLKTNRWTTQNDEILQKTNVFFSNGSGFYRVQSDLTTIHNMWFNHEIWWNDIPIVCFASCMPGKAMSCPFNPLTLSTSPVT